MTADARIASGFVRQLIGWFNQLIVVIRAHPYLTALLVAGTIMRVITMIAFQPALLFHADAYGYLRVADDLAPSQYRPSLYPILLKLAYPFQSLIPVVVTQHVIGVGMAIAIYVLLRRLGIGRAGSAVGAAPLFLDAYQLNIEHYVLSETLFQLLVIGALWLLSAAPTPSARSVASAGLLLGLGGITKVIGITLVVLVVAYLFWKRAGLRRVGLCVLASALPLLVYATWFYTVWGHFAITSRGPLILYGRVSPFADCATADLPGYQRVLCDQRPPSERPGTEFYVWRTEHPLSPLEDFEPPPDKDLQMVLGEFALRIIVSQPLDYARVVGGDMLHYFGFGRWEETRDASMEPWEFTDSFDTGRVDPAVLEAQKAMGENMPRVIRVLGGSPEATGLFEAKDPPEFRVVAPFARFLDSYQDLVYTPGPLLAVAALLGLAGAVLSPTPGRGRSTRPECFLFTSCGIALLLVPAATAVFDYRYLLPALPLLTVGGTLGAQTVTGRLQSRSSRIGENKTSYRSSPRHSIPPKKRLSVSLHKVRHPLIRL